MIELHHRYSAPSLMTTGDYLAGALEWTGATAGELMWLLRGTSVISTGFASAELDTLADTVAASDSAGAVIASPDDPEAVLDALAADPDAGPAARAYLDAVRYRSIGYDVGEPSAGELPAMLVGAIRAAVASRKTEPGDDGDAALTAIRARVPAEHLADFDDRLHEARLANRLRDERATYSDGWAVGLARRALLEAGRRLAGRGALADPAHAVDADAAELAALLCGEPGPTAEEVAERDRRRTSRTVDDAPPLLGPPPSPAPPLEALPERPGVPRSR
jgi:pyruvate,water dikinase